MATLRRQMKNMVKNYSDAEVKVREATSNDPWGPSSTLMSEISDLTYNITALGEVMRMLWKRLNDHGKNWRHVYKSLVLLDYLIKNGNEKVAQQCKEHIVAIQTLKDFQYMEEQKDQGASVREKAKQLVNLLRDDERLKQERAKAFRARERFAQNAMGISSDNKITFGNGAAPGGLHTGSSTRTSGNYADPYGGAATGASSLAPDLEAARPSDPNEEDLQIKLAIMMSQQEHEEDVQKRRADEAKLQIALEQSKQEGQPNNGLVDLGDFSTDPWGAGPSNPSRRPPSLSDDDSDDLFPPLSTLKGPNGAADPWATGPNIGTSQPDPWSQSKSSVQPSNPWNASPAASNVASLTSGAKDPWSTTSTASKPDKFDDFELFSNNRIATPTQAVANSTQQKAEVLDPFGDFFGGTSGPSTTNAVSSINSTNPWTTTSVPIKPTSTIEPLKQSSTTNGSAQSTLAGIRKTPESFLGENASLVNLQNLIPTSSSGTNLTTRPKSTNPFGAAVAQPHHPPMSSMMTNGLSTSMSNGQLNTTVNPFAAAQPPKPTISQLQQQQTTFPFNTQTTMAPFSNMQQSQQPTPSFNNTNLFNMNSQIMSNGDQGKSQQQPTNPFLCMM